jgi:hypothetical protein
MHYKRTTPRHIGVGLTHVGLPNVPWSCVLFFIIIIIQSSFQYIERKSNDQMSRVSKIS